MASVTVPPAPTADRVAAGIRRTRPDISGRVFQGLLVLSLAITLAILVLLLTDVASDGWSVLTGRLGSFLTSTLSSNAELAGVRQGIAGTVTIGLFVALFAFPVGVGAAIYLEEYAPRSWFTRLVDINIRNLAGVPSVVYGILGFAIFAKSLSTITGGRSVMAAGITLAILVLPIVIITSAESIRAVPNSIREAGYGVGATRWEVVRSHVLPFAAPGILTGTVLSLARALGEAAPLILVGAVTGSFSGGQFGDLQGRFTAMPTVIYNWARQQSEFRPNVAAAIVVLLAVVLLINAGAILMRNRYEKRR